MGHRYWSLQIDHGYVDTVSGEQTNPKSRKHSIRRRWQEKRIPVGSARIVHREHSVAYGSIRTRYGRSEAAYQESGSTGSSCTGSAVNESTCSLHDGFLEAPELEGGISRSDFDMIKDLDRICTPNRWMLDGIFNKEGISLIDYNHACVIICVCKSRPPRPREPTRDSPSPARSSFIYRDIVRNGSSRID